MRQAVTSRYNIRTIQLLKYLSARMGLTPQEAQRAAVLALAEDLIRRDRKEATDGSDSKDATKTDGVPPVRSEEQGTPDS